MLAERYTLNHTKPLHGQIQLADSTVQKDIILLFSKVRRYFVKEVLKVEVLDLRISSFYELNYLLFALPETK